MPIRPRLPIALTIAGSDSGGGAGLQADLKTMAAIGVHGTTAVTCLTAQNPRSVSAVHAVPPGFVAAQLEAVFAELPPRAVKTGMLFNAGIIRSVAGFLDRIAAPPLVVDPVMVATSGSRLLQPAAERALRELLLPRAALITPNLDEAAVLLGSSLSRLEDLRPAARALRDRFGVPVLLKGGHLRGVREAVDVFWDGRTELWLAAPFVRGVATHGTGCTYSAAVASYLALGCRLPKAVALSKEYITQAISQSRRVASHTVLEPFWE